MLVKQIHNNLSILLQKVNTHKSKNFLSQELDTLFNIMLDTYKNKKVDLRSNNKQISLFDTHTSLDTLSSLIESVKLHPINITKEEAIYLLPFNFYGWINSKANVSYDCSKAIASNIKTTFYKSISLNGLKNINLNELNTLNITLNYVDDNNISKTDLVFSYNDLPDDYLILDGNSNSNLVFLLINAIIKVINLKLDTINSNLINKFYIKYDNTLETIIIQRYGNFTVTIVNNGNPISTNSNSQFVDLNVLNSNLVADVAISDFEKENLIDNSYLSKSNIQNLRAIRTNNTIKIKIPKSVIIGSITVTYLKKPREIDYLLGISSDLPDNIVNKIIADTAQFAKGIISSDSYDKFAKENFLIE